jgi:hypothetical protein
VRARDHQHGDGSRDSLVGVVDEEQPDQERARRRGGRHVEEQPRCSIGECLRARPRRFGLRDETLDAGQPRPLADRTHPHVRRRAEDDGSGDDRSARGPFDGPRLAGDHRLVELDRFGQQLTVGGDPPAGPDQHDVLDREGGHGDGLGPVAAHPLGLVGEQLGERIQRAAGLAQRAHLHPMAEQHDDHECRELPPEVQAEEAERRRPARAERHRDRHRDQQHHPGTALASFVGRAGKERPAAVEVDRRAQHRRHEAIARERRRRVAEPVLDHRAVDDDRQA